ncbi:Ger(x)C family spore germination protein [Paenibacillus ehimensis]|uniref:Ger(X)C family spore germination protein n=1 Tax=Paenibacillus ehimensis TaxID=79264 RepID=A0ABT8VK53_9BACL|nr:Ger(x)C family spore germination protein [Paenibacillus ehimensis]MDO3681357.1 Ger(x)C family spore germination protein [Paenibacillus ehimensis]MEC0213607.1 Ger(x)C family spore germination protein [Paenibacillus ehimensis]
MRLRRTRLSLALLSLLCLTGCWDRVEINDLAFILTTAVDVEPDGKIRYSVLLPLPGNMGGASGGGGGTAGTKSYYIDSETGTTFREAQARLQQRMSRRMFLAHRRTVLISEDFAKRGIRDIFDATPRSPESRMTIYMIVTQGKAYELLQATPQFERFPSEAIRELAKARTTISINMKEVALALSSPGSDAVTVYMGVKESEKNSKKSKELELLGYAQFREDKMTGVFKNAEASGLAWLKNLPVHSTATVKVEDRHMITLSIHDTKCRIRSRPVRGKLQFDIVVEAKAKVIESLGMYDLSQTGKIRKVEAAMNRYIERAIKEAIRKMIANRADSAQFGSYLWRAHPRLWEKKYAPRWPAGMKDADYRIQVKSVLTETGLIYENVTKAGRTR